MKRALLIILFITIWIGGNGQAFSGKTNGVRLNYTEPVPATALPSIQWVIPRTERSNTTDQSVTFEAEVRSDIPLKRIVLELTVGGELHTKAIEIGNDPGHVSIHQPLRLVPGENAVKIVAENSNGGIVSSSRFIISGTEALAIEVDANRKDYALLIATDGYDNWGDLVNPVNDARTIEALIKEKYGFQTELLENPTLEEINDKIYEYNTKKFNPQDQLFIFVAGHGYFDETLGEGYLVATNSIKNDPGKSSYLSHVLLRQRLNNIKCEHIFLTMDVCFGGTFDPVLAKVRAEEAMDEVIDKQYLIKKLTKRTRKYLTSGGKEYVPDGTPGKHSPFAEKFILALKEVGGGAGNILSLYELRPYFLRLATEPRFDSFGDDDPASDFLFVAKH